MMRDASTPPGFRLDEWCDDAVHARPSFPPNTSCYILNQAKMWKMQLKFIAVHNMKKIYLPLIWSMQNTR